MAHGDTSVRRVAVSTEVIDADELRRLVADSAAGACVVFTGDVRDNDDQRSVVSLAYEAHPSAREALEKVAAEVVEDHDVIAVAVVHRHGPIPIGESALVAAASARHRQQAFDACVDLVEKTKQQIPIWKHQVFADGTDEWVNCA